MSQTLLTKEQILFFLHKFRNADISQCEVRAWLIDCFVNAVYVYDDGRIVPTFNYTNGTETISKDEIEETFGSTMTMGTPA